VRAWPDVSAGPDFAARDIQRLSLRRIALPHNVLRRFSTHPIQVSTNPADIAG
jgi:hypothetical protein